MRKNFSMLVVALMCFFAVDANAQCPMGAAGFQKRQPVNMILDADFGSSTDDLIALMMLNHYIDEGLVDLKGIVVDREGENNAGVVDIFNTYYGHPYIPVGLERNGVKNPRVFIPYNGICDLKDANGNPLFKRSFDASKCMDGWKLYRKILSKAEDKSITIVAIGFATSLAQLMESKADEYSKLSGIDLFAQKVKAVYIQSGRFEENDSTCGYNMRAASKQAAIFYEKLPESVELIMSPSYVGESMNYLPEDVIADLSWTEVNPIKAVYTNYTCDTGQRMWDVNCVTNAIFGDGQFNMSAPGYVTFVEKGEESLMLFKQDPYGNARYQLPFDTYQSMEKLMEMRRHNRMKR
ncbi:MAG: nucleoside hydrolase [Bacteroidaceae bacterium]|nr:nucleoside hydrolase [Bacteroidaceae bacterium]